jgi:hypothetical protein
MGVSKLSETQTLDSVMVYEVRTLHVPRALS